MYVRMCMHVHMCDCVCAQFSSDDEHMFCTCGSSVEVLSVATGKVLRSMEEASEFFFLSFFLFYTCRAVACNEMFAKFVELANVTEFFFFLSLLRKRIGQPVWLCLATVRYVRMCLLCKAPGLMNHQFLIKCSVNIIYFLKINCLNTFQLLS